MTTLVQPESCFVTANGLRLHYLDWGNLTAPPLVCSHGFAMSAQSFNGFARHFRDRFHIMSFDTRGHGDSGTAPPETYVFTYHLADFEGAVDALGLQRFTLVGSSAGGRTGILYTQRHPERVERLVMNDVGIGARPVGRPLPQGSVRAKEFSAPADAVPYLVQAMPPFKNLSAIEQAEQARGLLRQQEDRTWVWKLDQELLRQRHRPNAPRPPQMPDLWRVLEEIPCPTLVVWAQESHLLDEENARRMAKVLPQGEFVVAPGVGHPPWLTEPGVLEALERFLGEPE